MFSPTRIILVLTTVQILHIPIAHARMCTSVDVRNKVTKLDQLNGCTVVFGFVHIVLIAAPNITVWESYSYPELREITGYLLFFRVSNIPSVDKLFPNLAVIRGHKLLMDYALVLYNMPHLTQVAFPNLIAITRGYVRIEKNPCLCPFQQNVNWRALMTDEDAQVSNVIKEWDFSDVSPRKVCAKCSTGKCSCKYCWSANVCQKVARKLSAKKCHVECLGGCDASNNSRACWACAHFNDDGDCVADCGGKKLQFQNHCLSRNDCENIVGARLTWKNECVRVCPHGFDTDIDNPTTCVACHGPCRKKCETLALTDINSIRSLKGCNIINGSLEIHLETHQFAIKELYANLIGVEEIYGHLQIARTYFVTSLDFLPNLKVIHGKNTNKTISVYENPNLERLFDWGVTKELTLYTDNIFFHYNPKLCVHEINQLLKVAGLNRTFSAIEISTKSNGDRTICGHDKINVTARVINSSAVHLNWMGYNTPNTHTLIGYHLYYRAARLTTNLSFQHYADECYYDGWNLETVMLQDCLESNVSQLNPNISETTITFTLTNLEPFTRYAYFIQTYLIENYYSKEIPPNVGSTSEIKFVTTLPGKPDRPANFYAIATSDTQITLTWDAPFKSNGKLTHYCITGYLSKSDPEIISQRNYCLSPIDEPQTPLCKCQPSNHTCANTCSKTEPNDFISSTYRVTTRSFALEKHLKQLDAWDVDGYNHFTHSSYKRQGVYEIYQANVSVGVFKHAVHGLERFSLYVFYIAACNADEDVDESLCGSTEMTYERTKANVEGDNIGTVHIDDIQFGRGYVKQARWREPEHPNKIILFYTLQVRKQDANRHKHVIDTCVTRVQHKNNNNSYTIAHLTRGHYELRVRATSMSGTGQWTKWTAFEIRDQSHSLVLALLILLAALLALQMLYLACASTRVTQPAAIGFNRDDGTILLGDLEMKDASQLRVLQPIEVRHRANPVNRMLYKASVNGKAFCVKISERNWPSSFLLREIQILMKLTHPCVVRLEGVFTEFHPYVILLENLDNGTLRQQIQHYHANQSTTPMSLFIIWSAQLADAMIYLNNQNIHILLTASNVFLNDTYTCKISPTYYGQRMYPRDFLSPTKIFQYDRDYYRVNHALPMRWLPKSTILNGQVTYATTIWAYCVTIWEIVTCAYPFDDVLNENVIAWIMNDGKLTIDNEFPAFVRKLINGIFEHYNEIRFEEIVQCLLFCASTDFKETLTCNVDGNDLKQVELTNKWQTYNNEDEVLVDDSDDTEGCDFADDHIDALPHVHLAANYLQITGHDVRKLREIIDNERRFITDEN